MEKIEQFRLLLVKKFQETAARILGEDEFVDVSDMDAEDLVRVRSPFRTWLQRAGIGRREVNWTWSPVSRYALPGQACIGDFTMKGEKAVLDIPMELVEAGVLPEVLVERKRPEGPIVRGSRNTTRYEGLAGVGPSEDGRKIVFKFKNDTSFSWSIVDKKFYHSDTGVEFAQSHFGNIVWGEAKPGCPSFFETLYKTADEGWVKNLFAILSNWVRRQVDNHRRHGAYRLQEKRLNRLDTMCSPEVIGPIESLAKNNFIDRMNLDRVCQRAFVGDKILGFSDIKEKYALDAWFLRHSEERVGTQYIRDDRYAREEDDIYADENREWILGNYMEIYCAWTRAGMDDLFRHCWEEHRYVFTQTGYYFDELKDTFNQLKGWGYNLRRVVDYILRDLPMQGMMPKINGNTPHELTLLRDYARMMVEMDRKFDRYPKPSLKLGHDIAAKNYRVKKSEILAKKYECIKEGLKRYEFAADGYVVIVPPTMASVVQEGASLNHCVASYVDGMMEGKYAILFLRKEDAPEKSLVTIQVHDTSISQARGQNNRSVTEEEQNIIDKFVAQLNKQKELVMEEAA